jgi:hypothetical protein
VPYRTPARWTLIAVRRPATAWSALLALGAGASALAIGLVCTAIAERAGTTCWLDDCSGVLGAMLALALPSVLFACCALALHRLRRARIEIFQEAICVHTKSGADEARWAEIVALRRLFYRNLHDIAQDAGWALDTRDGRRIRIAMTYGDIEPELSSYLAPYEIGVTPTELDDLEALDASTAPRST